MSDHMVRDLLTATFWVFFVGLVVPAVLILMQVSRFVMWVDSKVPVNIGGPWLRFIEWYSQLLMDGLGVTDEAIEALPDSPETIEEVGQ